MLQNFLKQIPDISTYRELKEIKRYLEKNNRVLYSLLRNLLGEIWASNDWQEIDSYKINQDWRAPNIEHRLYINAGGTNNFKIMTLFVKKCDEYQIPYSFKFDETGTRDDSVVIYSSSLYLDKYVSILEEIKQELKLNNIQKTPLLTGVINGWIGYGSEPLGEKGSFTEKRVSIICDDIQKCISKWIYTHPNATLYDDNGQRIDIQDYLTSQNENIGKIIMENDDSFIMDVKNEIIAIGNEQGVDPNNFAFDVENERRLKRVEAAMNHFGSDITRKSIPKLNIDGFKYLFQDGILNVICAGDEETVQQVTKKVKSRFPNVSSDYMLVYDVDEIESQTLCACGNAIVINNKEDISIIGPNIGTVGYIGLEPIEKGKSRIKTI